MSSLGSCHEWQNSSFVPYIDQSRTPTYITTTQNFVIIFSYSKGRLVVRVCVGGGGGGVFSHLSQRMLTGFWNPISAAMWRAVLPRLSTACTSENHTITEVTNDKVFPIPMEIIYCLEKLRVYTRGQISLVMHAKLYTYLYEIGSLLGEHVDSPAVGTEEHGVGHAAVVPGCCLRETAWTDLTSLSQSCPLDLGLEHFVCELHNLIWTVIPTHKYIRSCS